MEGEGYGAVGRRPAGVFIPLTSSRTAGQRQGASVLDFYVKTTTKISKFLTTYS